MALSSRQRARSGLIAAGVLCLAAGIGSCSLFTGPDRTSPTPITSLPRELTPVEQRIASASTTFGLNLLSRVSRSEPDSNVFLSPLSAHTALGMALTGARGATFDSMRAALAFGNVALPAIDSAYAGLISLLHGLDPRVDFRLANSVWLKKGYPFLDSYRRVVKASFDARVQDVDFSDPATVDTINAWVDGATNGRIPRLLDAVPRGEIALLVNAVYFLGDWTARFDASETHQAPFHLDGGGTEPVELMHRTGTYRYGRGRDFQVAELPYGGGAFVMTVVLPDSGVSIDAFAAGLDSARWHAILASMDGPKPKLFLYLPKFTLTWGDSLQGPLSDMGMGMAFDPVRADFGRMVDLGAADGNVYLTFVLQKTFVRVDEQGTEAAAATGVGVGVTDLPSTIVFRVDRPFLFAIRERLSGTLLFLGRIARPPAG